MEKIDISVEYINEGLDGLGNTIYKVFVSAIVESPKWQMCYAMLTYDEDFKPLQIEIAKPLFKETNLPHHVFSRIFLSRVHEVDEFIMKHRLMILTKTKISPFINYDSNAPTVQHIEMRPTEVFKPSLK